MKIVIAGATGFIGKPLSEYLLKQGHDLVILTREIKRTASRSARVQHVVWTPNDEHSIASSVDGADALINLAGEPVIGKRWSKAQKHKLRSSRVNATRTLMRSLEGAKQRPKILINASAIGFYGPRGNESLDEAASKGQGFLADVCKEWEDETLQAARLGLRVVRLRIGVVLGVGGGALQKMLPPFKMFAGGWLGSGNQWMSWIHLKDMIGLIEFCLRTDSVAGEVNATAPQPVTNKAFSLVLAQILKRPCIMPVPGIAIKILLGEAGEELLLKGQKVMPQKALDHNFVFQYPEIRGALSEILKP